MSSKNLLKPVSLLFIDRLREIITAGMLPTWVIIIHLIDTVRIDDGRHILFSRRPEMGQRQIGLVGRDTPL